MIDLFYSDDSSKDKGSIKLSILMAAGILLLVGTVYQEITGASATEVLSGDTVSELLSLHR